MFFFHLTFNKNGKLILGNGSDENHLHIMMTSKKMIRLLDSAYHSKGCYHQDYTYKITKNGFPLLVFGISDQAHRFHPIAFGIMSHEQEIDFEEFYKGLIDLSKKFYIAFNPEYIMQDAWDASYKSAIKNFEDVNILMCWYHVMANVICLLKNDLY